MTRKTTAGLSALALVIGCAIYLMSAAERVTARNGLAVFRSGTSANRDPGQQSQAKNSAHIWVVDVATGRAHILAAHDQPYADETPSWFPDGKRIAFQSNRTGRMEIWVMNVDGSKQRQVTGL